MPAKTAAAADTDTAKLKRRGAVKAFKREAILQAARTIFARDGLDGATLRAIAAEAGEFTAPRPAAIVRAVFLPCSGASTELCHESFGG